MYNDLFSIGPVTVHGYGLMIGIGFLCCVLMGVQRAKKHDMDRNAAIDIALLGVFIGFLGAKILYVIVEFDRFLKSPMAVLGSEGFVVYGGIVSGVIAVIIYCRVRKLRFLDYFDLLAPSISVAQGFGRIGCFLAGCCYGRETSSALGVVFPEGSLAPSGVPLLPTQLFSAAGDFVIMFLCLALYKRRRHSGDIGALYLLLYGLGRFAIEFFRSDDRGVVGSLSTSQFISIFIVIAAIVMFLFNRRRDAKAAEAGTDNIDAETHRGDSDEPDTAE